MRFMLLVTTCLIVLTIGLVEPLAAKDKGGGGRGKGGGGHSHKAGQQRGSQGDGKSTANKGGAAKEDRPDKTPKPPKEKHTDKVADKEKEPKEKTKKGDDSQTDTDEPEGDSPEPYNKKEKQLQLAQKHRDKKIAQAEHLRAIAERNGNANLLANADRMEAQANAEYAKRVAHLEKFGVTDPTLDPLGPDGDPLVPSGDPLFPTGAN